MNQTCSESMSSDKGIAAIKQRHFLYETDNP